LLRISQSIEGFNFLSYQISQNPLTVKSFFGAKIPNHPQDFLNILYNFILDSQMNSAQAAMYQFVFQPIDYHFILWLTRREYSRNYNKT
jgi:hypothetical protein